jgi:ABC-type cobalamin/Fe3+-siderophores transport system ATPase subunit
MKILDCQLGPSKSHFEIFDGDFIVVTGPKGSGKSSLLEFFLTGQPHSQASNWKVLIPTSEFFIFSNNFLSASDVPFLVKDIVSLLTTPYSESYTDDVRALLKRRKILEKSWTELDRQEKIEVVLLVLAVVSPRVLVLDDLLESLFFEERNQILQFLFSKFASSPSKTLQTHKTDVAQNLSCVILTSSILKKKDFAIPSYLNFKGLELSGSGILSLPPSENGTHGSP